MKKEPTFNFDLTYITLILGIVATIVNNNVFNITMICLLVSVSITGFILVNSHKKTLLNYYNQQMYQLQSTNILSHILIPSYLIYILIKNTTFNVNVEQMLTIFILINVHVYLYYILMRMGHFGGYNLPPGILIKYGIAIVFICLSILLFLI